MTRLLTSLLLAAYTLLTLTYALTKSPGCGKPLPAGTKTGGPGLSNNISLTTPDGTHRTYLLHVPKSYLKTDPHGLIFSFHGRGQSALHQEKLSKFSESNINPHMLAAYPEGISQQWQGDPEAKTDDVAFTMAMLRQIGEKYCIDLDKVYASGKSNGGGFAVNVLACDPVASRKIAAFAGFAGAYYQHLDGKKCSPASVPITCNPGRKPVPIFEVHGLADEVIPYNGGKRRGSCLPSLPHYVTEWGRRNGEGTANVSTSTKGGRVVKFEFGKEKGLEGVVTHYRVKGLGHEWVNDDLLSGSEEVMKWFGRWTLSNPATPVASKTTSKSTTKPTPTSTQPLCPNSNGTVLALADNTRFRILCASDTTASYYREPIYNTGNFGNCIKACRDDERCGYVAYNGVCYLKKGRKPVVKNAGGGVEVAVRVG